MQIKTVISRIRKHKPTSPTQFREAGVRLEEKALGSGAFREVVKVKDCALVVKFPLAEGQIAPDSEPDYREGIAHSVLEMKKLARLREFRWMRPHLPKVHYYDRKNGIIVMRYYPMMKESDYMLVTADFVRTLIRRCTGVTIADYCQDNVGDKGKQKLVLIDLGY